jgi:hypothetical protein
MKRLAPLALAATLAMSQAACLGSNSAFNAVHRWNGTATNSRPVNSLIHFALWVIPVYEVTLFGDVIIFNNVEYFTGKPVFGA